MKNKQNKNQKNKQNRSEKINKTEVKKHHINHQLTCTIKSKEKREFEREIARLLFLLLIFRTTGNKSA